MTLPVIFEGARVLLPDGVQSVSVRVEGGRITGLDQPADGARRIDAAGHLLAPAFVDIHGDAFERHLMPRPGVSLPVDGAMLDTDRDLASNGVATAYHALTLSWEPGLRSVDMGWQVHDALARLRPRLTVEHRLQLRWETFCVEAMPLIRAAMAGPLTPALAFNDHLTAALLHPSVPMQDKPFDFAPDFPVTDINSPGFAAKMEARAKRSHMRVPDFVALVQDVWTRRPQVQSWVETLAAEAQTAGAPMLSHDDTQTETRQYYRDRGVRLAEFPMNQRTARFARDGGDFIVLGAPNAARGGSHLGSVGAAEMIGQGLCDILASDYHYPALLSAMARLLADGLGPLHRLWPLVSANPALALGLTDRGTLAPGQRADLLLIDWPEGGIPVVRQTWVGGRCAYAAQTPAAV